MVTTKSSGKAREVRDERSQEGAHETDRDRDQKAAGRSPGDGSTDGSANPGDDEQDQKSSDGEGHGLSVGTTERVGQGPKGLGR